MLVYLIRHGESENNSSKFISEDSNDCNLTKNGITQVKSLRKWAETVDDLTIYSSPSKRTIQTGHILFDKEIILVDEFREINKGFEIDIYHEPFLVVYTLDEWALYKKNTHLSVDFVYSSGESVRVMRDRVFTKLLDIAKNGHVKGVKSICILTHNGPIKAILSTINGDFESSYFSLNIKNASIHKLESSIEKNSLNFRTL